MGIWDPRLNAWILDGPGEVAAALRDPRLVPALARASTPAAPLDAAAHAEFRAQALHALAPEAIQHWEEHFELTATRCVDALPIGEPVDLIERYARPYSLAVASITAGVPTEDIERLAALAGHIFEAACEPYDAGLAARSQTSTVELATFFRNAPPWTVQMFAALTHSLPALLGNLWLDDALRSSGPAKAVFRQAIESLIVGDCKIARDQRVILRLNADMTFGAGIHSCVGASLVKSAATIATRALFHRFTLGPHTAVEVDRFAMRYLSSLTVVLSA